MQKIIIEIVKNEEDGLTLDVTFPMDLLVVDAISALEGGVKQLQELAGAKLETERFGIETERYILEEKVSSYMIFDLYKKPKKVTNQFKNPSDIN